MASYVTELVCPLCPLECTAHLCFDLTSLLRHVKLFHAHQAGFKITCGIGGCQRTFRTFRTYENHISAMHRHQPDAVLESPSVGSRDGANDDMDVGCEVTDNLENLRQGEGARNLSADLTEASSLQLQRSCALFLMGLKEKHKLTQGALQSVIEGVTSLQQERIGVLHSMACSKLMAEGIEHSSVPGLDALFSVDGDYGRPFAGLETQHQQDKYYKTHFQFIVSTIVRAMFYVQRMHFTARGESDIN